MDGSQAVHAVSDVDPMDLASLAAVVDHRSGRDPSRRGQAESIAEAPASVRRANRDPAMKSCL